MPSYAGLFLVVPFFYLANVLSDEVFVTLTTTWNLTKCDVPPSVDSNGMKNPAKPLGSIVFAFFFRLFFIGGVAWAFSRFATLKNPFKYTYPGKTETTVNNTFIIGVAILSTVTYLLVTKYARLDCSKDDFIGKFLNYLGYGGLHAFLTMVLYVVASNSQNPIFPNLTSVVVATAIAR
jgi:hypothetical protein